jgi:FkbM family methyltransferase
MRELLAQAWIQTRRLTPEFRGKQWLSRAITSLLRPVAMKTEEGIILQTLLSSSMDLSFLDPNGGGHELIRGEIKALKPGDKVLDIGANTGFFSLLAAATVGDEGLVIAIEPSGREFGRLLANIDANRANNILALNIATGERPGIQAITIEPDNTGLNKIAINPSQRHKTQPCQLINIDRLDLESLGAFAIAKIDAEGYELFTLRGMNNLLESRTINRIPIEISPIFLQQHGQSSDQIYQLMAGHGYMPIIGPQNNSQWDEVFTGHWVKS